MKREWDSATTMAKERVASLTAECATTRATLQEQKPTSGKIAVTKTEQEKLWSRIAELTDDRDKEFKRAEELTLEESQGRAEKAETAHQQLRDEINDELRLCVEKCLRGFAMWVLQSVKWLKLDSLEQRLMSTKAIGSAGHKQLVELG
ncbi:hypothetical protein AXG93_4776s1000 [Marchantia polymorpha subsp. ruderalis]|uniref:Uncharacterized protein n=1 Tax=Marchantia polymorpha subsp. ruderalis TaxID=1480154 RepID=A0A176VS69_MARPO|nr:hypothetical protein AXG93_4776s1000 [Marchantia polymorpha subsp. ruderalis]